MTADWKVGQAVTVIGGFDYAPQSIHKVARVMKRFLELSDGSRWDHGGHPYPYQRGGYHRPSIAPATNEHAVAIKRARMIDEIDRWLHAKGKLKDMPGVMLEAIHELVIQHQKESGEPKP